MTNSQLQYAKLLEDRRHAMETEQIDRVKNAETERSNRAKEFETSRSNKVKELETSRSNKAKEFETTRSNLAKEAANQYANVTGRMKASNDYSVNVALADIAKRNADLRAAELAETTRHNTAQDTIGAIKATTGGIRDISSAIGEWIPG